MNGKSAFLLHVLFKCCNTNSATGPPEAGF